MSRESRLGQLLVELGHVQPQQLDWALEESDRSRKDPVEILCDAEIIDGDRIAHELGRRSGFEVVQLSTAPIHPSVLAYFPVEFAVAHRVVPVARRMEPDGVVFFVATCDPVDEARQLAVKALIPKGARLEWLIASVREIRAALIAHYRANTADLGISTVSVLRAQAALGVERALEDALSNALDISGFDAPASGELEDSSQTAPSQAPSTSSTLSTSSTSPTARLPVSVPAKREDAERSGPKVGRYLLLERTGVSGMAEIYSAVPEGRRAATRVTLRRLLPSLLGNARARKLFLGESKRCLSLIHQNIWRVHEVKEDENDCFVVLEGIDAQDLARILNELRRQRRRLPVDLCLYVTSEILSGLIRAHDAKSTDGMPQPILHLTLSPSQIYFTQEGRILVGDFGVEESTFKQKVGYLAKEQIAALERPDVRTDVFLVGLILFELLTGQRLEGDIVDLPALQRTLDAVPSRMRSLGVEVPAMVAKILERCLAFEPKDRYGSAADFRSEIEAARSVGSALAGGDELAQFLRNLVRRRTGSDNAVVITRDTPYVREPENRRPSVSASTAVSNPLSTSLSASASVSEAVERAVAYVEEEVVPRAREVSAKVGPPLEAVSRRVRSASQRSSDWLEDSSPRTKIVVVVSVLMGLLTFFLLLFSQTG